MQMKTNVFLLKMNLVCLKQHNIIKLYLSGREIRHQQVRTVLPYTKQSDSQSSAIIKCLSENLNRRLNSNTGSYEDDGTLSKQVRNTSQELSPRV